MLSIARVCQRQFHKTLLISAKPVGIPSHWARNFNDCRDSSRAARIWRAFKESMMKPIKGTSCPIAIAAVGGGAIVALGAICHYGLRQANKPDQSKLFPEYVKERIETTYIYLGLTLILSGVSAAACSRLTILHRRKGYNPLFATAVSMSVMVVSGMLVESIPYQPGFGAKQIAWMAHSGFMGAAITPLCKVAGPLATRAVLYTAGVVGGLSAVAACSRSDEFVNMAGPLSIGLGIVIASSLGAIVISSKTALGASLSAVSLYGGLLYYSCSLLYNTRKLIENAKTHPLDAAVPFDPINGSITVYSNIFDILNPILSIVKGSDKKTTETQQINKPQNHN